MHIFNIDTQCSKISTSLLLNKNHVARRRTFPDGGHVITMVCEHGERTPSHTDSNNRCSMFCIPPGGFQIGGLQDTVT